VRRVTLGELADSWLRAVAIEPNRDVRNDESRVRKLFGAIRVNKELREGARFGFPRDMPALDLDEPRLFELIDARRDEENTGATINRELALIQAMFAFGKVRKWVVPNVTFKALKQDEGDGKMRWLRVEEELALIDVLTKRVNQHGGQIAQDQLDLVIFLLDTGCRYSEAAELSWDCVDFTTRTINIYRSKVGNEGTLTMTRRLAAVLDVRRALTTGRRFIFPAGHGKKWSIDDVPRGYSTAGIRSALIEAEINTPEKVARFGRATTHSLRDTFASRLVQAGVPLYRVQKLLGHATPTMTQKYAHLSPEQSGREAAAVLDRIHAPAKPLILESAE
jgi:integrase